MAKVLLVEDDNNLREIYEARLAAEGYDIVTAKDGEDALAVAKQHKPDLIISDVMMPRISGFEMLDILRNTDGLKNTKIVMLTALGQSDDRTRADSLGADRYLVKSQVTLEDIVKTAEELLSPDYVPPTQGGAGGSTATPGVTPTEPAATPPEAAEATTSPAGIVTPETPATPSADQAATPAKDPVKAPVQEATPAEPQVPPTGTSSATSAVAPTPSVSSEPTAQPAPSAPLAPPAPEESQAVPAQPQPDLTLPTIPTTPDPAPQEADTDTAGVTTSPSVSSSNDSPTASAAPEPAVTQQQAPASEPTSMPFIPEATPVASEQPVMPTAAVPEAPTTDPAQQPMVTSPDIPVVEQPDMSKPATTPTDTEAPKIQMPDNPAENTVVDAQSTSQESAAVEQQIEDFVQNESVPRIDDSVNPPVPTAPRAEDIETPETEKANGEHEEIITNAMNDLMGNEQTQDASPAAPADAGVVLPEATAQSESSTDSVVPPTEEPTQSKSSDGSQIAGKKIIRPITSPEKQADIGELAAQEEIKENLAKGITGDPVVAEAAKPQQAPEPGVIPTSPQVTTQPAQPGGVFTPNTDGNAQENAL